MSRALDDVSTHGKVYELCGPRQYTLKELVELVCRMTGHRRAVVGLSDRLSYWQAFVMEKLPGKLITRDNVRSMQVPSVCTGSFPFGIRPQALEAAAPAYLASIGPRERYPRLRWRARR
jgi:NADH dehydrogenase